MSALNEDGVMAVRSAACDRLLASRVDLKLKVGTQHAAAAAAAVDVCSKIALQSRDAAGALWQCLSLSFLEVPSLARSAAESCDACASTHTLGLCAHGDAWAPGCCCEHPISALQIQIQPWQPLLQPDRARRDLCIQGKRISDVTNRMHVALPKPRDGLARPPVIPDSVMAAALAAGGGAAAAPRGRKLQKEMQVRSGSWPCSHRAAGSHREREDAPSAAVWCAGLGRRRKPGAVCRWLSLTCCCQHTAPFRLGQCVQHAINAPPCTGPSG